MSEADRACVYGAPPPDLALAPPGARQVSPLVPGADALEDVVPASLAAVVVAAPPGTLERRYVLALALRALKPGGALIALAPKDRGGARLGKELQAFGCKAEETGRRHHRICVTTRPDDPVGLDATLAAGGPRQLDGLGWTQAGVFSWDRIDPGSRLLAAAAPPLAGHGVDLGCGTGVLAQAVLRSGAVTRLELVDMDHRAIRAARRNIEDGRAVFHWADARQPLDLRALDFAITNPPFHDTGQEDKALGQAFLAAAHRLLRPGGVLWLVANRHLPYERVLSQLFSSVALNAEAAGFKIYEARK